MKPVAFEDPAAPSSVRALERSHGRARLGFERVGERTVLRELYQSGSAKARAMRLDNAGFKEVILINTSGGMTDGDRFESSVAWAESARGVVTTQAAERIYRSRGEPAEICSRLRVGAGACAVWAPQESILFDGGRFRRRTEIDVAATGEVIACESIVFGRTAMGEQVRAGSVDDGWRVRVGGRMVYADGLALDGDIQAHLQGTAVAHGGNALATLLYAGPRAREMRDAARGALERVLENADAVGGATTRLGVTVVRLIARSSIALRAALEATLEAMLATLAPPHPAPPRAWGL